MKATRDLKDADVRRLTQQVIAPDAVEPFGVYLLRSAEPGAELGRHVERTVFLETFGNTPELLADEYAPYEDASLFICVIDHLRRLPAGVMRLVLPSSAGFKSLNDIEPWWGEPAQVIIERTGLAMDMSRTWDVATLAVMVDYRGKATAGLVSMGLYQTATIMARNSGIEWVVAILDMPVYRLIRKLSMPFFGYKGVLPMPYLGAVSNLPVWCHISEVEERRLARANPEMYAILIEGTGLEPALRPLDFSQIQRLVA
jgi:hypothetical protein